MNLIGNSCIPAYLYKYQFKVPYSNPFMWSTMDFRSIYYLATHFNSINFDSFVISKDENKPGCYKLELEGGLIVVYYIHYIESQDYKTPTVINTDLYYSEIYKYVVTSYLNRLKAMKSKNESPIFILDATKIYDPIPIVTESQVQTFVDLRTPKLIASPTDYKIKLNNYTRVLRSDDPTKGIMAKRIYEKKLLSKWGIT